MDISIHRDRSSIENFYRLNSLNNHKRKAFTLTHQQDPCIVFSDRQLATLFWKHAKLKQQLQDLTFHNFQPRTEDPNWRPVSSENIIQKDLMAWIGHEPPGSIIKTFICKIGPLGRGRAMRPQAGIKGAIKSGNIFEIQDHIEMIQSEAFNVNNYAVKGYYLQGTIVVNQVRVYANVFKLRTLNRVKYRKLSPDSPFSMTQDLDRFLTEVRHVIKDRDDLQQYFGNDCNPEDIKIAGIDTGDKFLVAQYVYTPENTEAGPFRNLTIKQTAAYQPI